MNIGSEKGFGVLGEESSFFGFGRYYENENELPYFDQNHEEGSHAAKLTNFATFLFRPPA